MEKDRNQRYAESLERTAQNNHRYLKEAVGDFREMCLRVTPERAPAFMPGSRRVDTLP